MPDVTEPDSALDPSSNALAFMVTEASVSELLSPVAELSQRAVPVSPFLNAPDVPLPPVTLIFPAVTVGAIVSTVYDAELVVGPVELPALSTMVAVIVLPVSSCESSVPIVAE